MSPVGDGISRNPWVSKAANPNLKLPFLSISLPDYTCLE